MLKNHSLGGASAPAAKTNSLEGLDTDQLLAMRHRIDVLLNIDINKLNLADELGLQYRTGMTLLASVAEDSEVPPNQRAQVMNSVNATLKEIIKQTKTVYNAERLKRYEAAVLKILRQLPEESRRTFFDLYGDYLKEE